MDRFESGQQRTKQLTLMVVSTCGKASIRMACNLGVMRVQP